MIYVGATIVSAARRWSAHRCAAKRGDNRCGGEFYSDIRKYGEESFSLTTLEDGITSKEDLKDRENFWIDKYRAEGTAYNPCGSTAKGFKHTDEVKAKISAAHKGKPKSDETKAKISAGNKGKVMSDESRAKMSAAKKGKKRGPYKKRAAKLTGPNEGQTKIKMHN